MDILSWTSILIAIVCVGVGFISFQFLQSSKPSPPPPKSTSITSPPSQPVPPKIEEPAKPPITTPPTSTPPQQPSESGSEKPKPLPILTKPQPRPTPPTSAKGNDFMKQFLAKPVEKELEKLFEECCKFWQRPLEELSVFKDLGRLAKRTEIYKMDEIKKGEEKEGGEIILGFPSQQDSSIAVVKLIRVLSQKLEDPEIVEMVEKILPSQDSAEDLELFVKSLFSKGLKNATKTTNILKTMHQQMIFNSSLILKKLILESTGTLLKDSADAWRVRILVTPDEIEVRHVRREESTSPEMMKSLTLAPKTNGDYPGVLTPGGEISPDIPPILVQPFPSKPQQHFIVEWELRLHFSLQVNELKAVKLKVVNLTFPRHLRNLELSVFNHLSKHGLV